MNQKQSLTIKYNDKIVFQLTDLAANYFERQLNRLISRSSYLEAALNDRWDNQNQNNDNSYDNNNKICVIPQVDQVSNNSNAVQIVLGALLSPGDPSDGGSAAGQLTNHSFEDVAIGGEAGGVGSSYWQVIQHQEEIVIVSFYLGCHDYILKQYCSLVTRATYKEQVLYSLYYDGHALEARSLLLTKGFLEVGFEDRYQIPLLAEYCFDLECALHLLKTYDQRTSATVAAGGLSFLGRITKMVHSTLIPSNEKRRPKSLSSTDFAIIIIQMMCQEEEEDKNDDRLQDDKKEDDDINNVAAADSGAAPRDYMELVFNLELVFKHLPTSLTNNLLPPKPEGLERLITKAILLGIKIPAILRNWPGLDVAAIVPALVDSNRLPEYVGYPNPTRIIEVVVNGWTTQDCFWALHQDLGGIRKVLEDSSSSTWIANIPIFLQTCREMTTLTTVDDDDEIRKLLYRRLFPTIDFDPQLPPSLLSCLEGLLHSRDISEEERLRLQDKILQHAVLHLEQNGGASTVATIGEMRLPWHAAGIQLTRRAAIQLREYDDSIIWKSLDIEKLSSSYPGANDRDDYLECVPPRILSRYAYIKSIRASEETKQCQIQVRKLEKRIQDMERKIHKQNEEIKTLRRNNNNH